MEEDTPHAGWRPTRRQLRARGVRRAAAAACARRRRQRCCPWPLPPLRPAAPSPCRWASSSCRRRARRPRESPRRRGWSPARASEVGASWWGAGPRGREGVGGAKGRGGRHPLPAARRLLVHHAHAPVPTQGAWAWDGAADPAGGACWRALSLTAGLRGVEPPDRRTPTPGGDKWKRPSFCARPEAGSWGHAKPRRCSASLQGAQARPQAFRWSREAEGALPSDRMDGPLQPAARRSRAWPRAA